MSATIRAADDVAALAAAAQTIRQFVRSLLAQGVGARHTTELISHLNDVLTERLVRLMATRHGLDLHRACWLAFGSEGRSEQTIATDQDNGIVFESDDPARDRPAWLRFAHDVNQALDACGYPLCRGNVMASNPECCLSPREWRERFASWIDHGAPAGSPPRQHLLRLSPDRRPRRAGRALARGGVRAGPDACRGSCGSWQRTRCSCSHRSTGSAASRREPSTVARPSTSSCRARRCSSTSRASMRWRTAVPRPTPDLRLLGTAALGAPAHEAEGWVAAFEFLQTLRLQAQIEYASDAAAAKEQRIRT